MTTWTTRDGSTIDVAEMDVNHARNTLNYLLRNAHNLLTKAWIKAETVVPPDGSCGELTLSVLSSEAHRLRELLGRSKKDPTVAIEWLLEDRRELIEALRERIRTGMDEKAAKRDAQPEAQQKHVYDYPKMDVTVDVVVLTTSWPPEVLLIRRGNEPFAGQLALPGGYVGMDETARAAAVRELREETGIHLLEKDLRSMRPRTEVGRDPRGRTISLPFVAVTSPEILHSAKAGDDAAAVEIISASELNDIKMAFDHEAILLEARWRS